MGEVFDSLQTMELIVSTRLVLPKMTTTARDAMTNPVSGTIIYNTTTNKINFYNGSGWEAVTSA